VALNRASAGTALFYFGLRVWVGLTDTRVNRLGECLPLQWVSSLESIFGK
jgi:hypothetical protein